MCNHEMLFTLSIQIHQLNVWNVENLVIHKKTLSNVIPIFTTDILTTFSTIVELFFMIFQ